MNVRLQEPGAKAPGPRVLLLRAVLTALSLTGLVLVGFAMGRAQAAPDARPAAQAVLDFNTLRLHGYPALGHPDDPPYANRPASAGSDTYVDPTSGLPPEDAPYTEGSGPFDPLSDEAPEMDFATWNPVWISERMGNADLQAMWPGLNGIDEVSAASNLRAGGINASEKVWLRHWYEPMHLDLDINADGRLTADDEDDGDYGVPDAPSNPVASAIDEWYPAIMTELTYMLVDNDPLPQRNPDPSALGSSAPRSICGRAGSTSIIFPVGISEAQADPTGDAEGFGLTSLDSDFDGEIDMLRVADELSLPNVIGGIAIDFDGDGVIEPMDPDDTPLSCDELLVMHTEQLRIEPGERVQLLDHYVEVRSVTGSSAVMDVYYTGDLVPRLIQSRSLGIGSVLLAGDTGPVQVIPPGGDNLGNVPVGAWFAYLQDADGDDDSAIVVLGRALGAPCAAMSSAPMQTNREPGNPYFLKRMYVDGHEYNTTAIYTCDTRSMQYITLRAPIPKVPVTIEQHSVRLQGYDFGSQLPLPPPYNYEHTILEDIVAGEAFDALNDPDDPEAPRPTIHYMGGPIGPLPPVLEPELALPYVGRDADAPIGPYDDVRAMRWMYIDEDVNPAFLGQLREKLGASRTELQDPTGAPAGVQVESFFYNEQIFTLPWNFTEFVLPDYEDGIDPDAGFDPDNYQVTTGFTNPTARWRRWQMPDGGVPGEVPPSPPDLIDDITGDAGFPLGQPRRAAFEFDPDQGGKILTDEGGVRLFGGQPDFEGGDNCDPTRPKLEAGAGDLDAVDPIDDGLPIEVAPYSDPFGPFNPQHPHAPRGDSLTFNPAYMDEFLNFDEALRQLYAQISSNGQNAREKVYHRSWYEPDYTTKIRFAEDCARDLSFPAVMQEYTFLYMNMMDSPGAAPAGRSRFGFPIGTRADELPAPSDGSLPDGGDFGYGLTTFDADFDERPDAVTIHDEITLASALDASWQANRPSFPGMPPVTVPGPELDFDGDGQLDDLDEDNIPLTGDEMVVFAVEGIVLDLDPATPEGDSAMLLDHMVSLVNVSRGERAQLQFWFTGGDVTNARPTQVGGLRALDIGDAALVDRFQDAVQVVGPGDMNSGPDGAWFAFVETVDPDEDRVTVTIGRALGATHSAIDDGAGRHDLEPGDPWYLKRFYVDGHEYNAVALMTLPGGTDGDDQFQFITIRTPVPKGNYFNPQDTLFQQGYFLDGLPAEMSVMPPFNVDHTIARDVERMELGEFADPSGLGACTGPLEAAGPMVEVIEAEEPEPRFWTELREIWDREEGRATWQTDQMQTTPYQYTEISLPNDQQYLLTSNWTSPVSRLGFYGCTAAEPGPFEDGLPGIDHETLVELADAWGLPEGAIIPPPNRDRVVEVDNDDVTLPYYDARTGPRPVRMKLFYDPNDPNDPFINDRPVTITLPTQPGLGIDKLLISADPTVVGAEVSFVITVTNTGDTILTGVDVADSFDTDYLDYVSATIAPTTVDEDAGTLLWEGLETNAPGGTFDPGEQILITVRFLATSPTPLGTRAGNRVIAVADGDVTVPMPGFDDVEIGLPALEVDKQLATSDPTTIGSTVTFTVTVRNTGTLVLTDVDVFDSFDTDYLDFVSATITPTIANELTGDLVWQDIEGYAPGGTFDPGEQIDILVNFMAEAASPDPDKAVNSVFATARDGSVRTDPETDEVEIDEPLVPSVQIGKQLTSPSPTTVGSTVIFEITVTNNGNTVLTDVDVFDTFPVAQLEYVTASLTPSNVNVGTMEWQDIESNAPGGTFDPGETIVITVEFLAVGVAPAPEGAVNSAMVNAEGDTVSDGPARARVVIDPEPLPSVSIDKSLLTPSPTTVGAVVSFVITVVNDGDSALTDVDLADSFDTSYLDFFDASIAPSSIGELAGSLTWNDIEGFAPGGTFDPGEIIIIYVDFIATAATPDPLKAENSVTVSAEAGTVLDGPALADVEIEQPSIQIDKVLLTSAQSTVGETVVFEITLTNDGTIPLIDVNLADNFDTDYLDWQGNAVPAADVDEALGAIIWYDIESFAPNGNFDPGESIVITTTFQASAATPSGVMASNSAFVATNGANVSAGPVSAELSISQMIVQLEASCQSVGDRAVEVAWVDSLSSESEFEIQASVDGSGFMTLGVDPSVSALQTDVDYNHTFENLLPGRDHSFRVRARNPQTGELSAWSEPTEACGTVPPGAGTTGCVEGSIMAQGRVSHAGLPVLIDGAPAATTGAGGSFQICGVPAGPRTLSAGGACYLRTESVGTRIEAEGAMTRLPEITLRGGDVNADAGVNIYDLARVGADFRASPPNDEMADCTGDGTVNIFDMVLVGSNFDLSGPLAWSTLVDEGGSDPVRLPFLRPAADLSRGPVSLRQHSLDDDTVAVDILVRTARPLYGADVTLSYDPEQVEPVAAPETDGAARVEPGSNWRDEAYVVRNGVDEEGKSVRFAASLRRPAAPLTGEVLLGTVYFRLVAEAPVDVAWSLAAVQLSDPRGNPLEAVWNGTDIEVPVEREGLGKTIYMPFAAARWADLP